MKRLKAMGIYIAEMLAVLGLTGVFTLFFLWCAVKDEGPHWTFGHFLWEFYSRIFQ